MPDVLNNHRDSGGANEDADKGSNFSEDEWVEVVKY
jgi:hypothetical protein